MKKTLFAIAIALLLGGAAQAAQQTQDSTDTPPADLTAACQQEAREVGLQDAEEIANYTQDCVAARSYGEEAPGTAAPAPAGQD